MRLEYSEEMFQTVVDHEEKMLAMYTKEFDQYLGTADKYGMTAHFDISWMNGKTKQMYQVRPDIVEGYQCFVNFTLLKQRRKVYIHCSTDLIGYDDYPLEASLIISYMQKVSRKVYMYLYDDVDDLYEYIDKFLHDLEDPMFIAVIGEDAP